jgi:lipid-binding SYLF domain-containing protein
MKKSWLWVVVITTVLSTALPSCSAFAQEDWKSLKRKAKRMKIDETAQGALDTLFAKSTKAQLLNENSYGWAVFDNLKLALGFSGGGGNGVAVVRSTGERTYMQMGTAGIGLGLGANSYQVVFFFQDELTFRSFVNQGWQADATASAVAGEAGAEAKTDFTNGLAIFQITDKGLMLHADIAGTKYWKNTKLNR